MDSDKPVIQIYGDNNHVVYNQVTESRSWLQWLGALVKKAFPGIF